MFNLLFSWLCSSKKETAQLIENRQKLRLQETMAKQHVLEDETQQLRIQIEQERIRYQELIAANRGSETLVEATSCDHNSFFRTQPASISASFAVEQPNNDVITISPVVDSLAGSAFFSASLADLEHYSQSSRSKVIHTSKVKKEHTIKSKVDELETRQVDLFAEQEQMEDAAAQLIADQLGSLAEKDSNRNEKGGYRGIF